KNQKGKIGTYYLGSKEILDVVIENQNIVQGIYKLEDDEEKYLFDVDISGNNEEKVLLNIKHYLKKKKKQSP
ncbi:hypothetical protein ACQPUZ_20365, partial [Clostridium tertium]